jgi:hypothetical protein
MAKLSFEPKKFMENSQKLLSAEDTRNNNLCDRITGVGFLVSFSILTAKALDVAYKVWKLKSKNSTIHEEYVIKLNNIVRNNNENNKKLFNLHEEEKIKYHQNVDDLISILKKQTIVE